MKILEYSDFKNVVFFATEPLTQFNLKVFRLE
jgi:hypothetical protein